MLLALPVEQQIQNGRVKIVFTHDNVLFTLQKMKKVYYKRVAWKNKLQHCAIRCF